MRWYLKKLARKSVAFTSLITGLLESGDRPSNCPPVRVLTYHRFGAVERDPFCVSLEDFEAQMAWLASQKLAVSLADVEGFLAGKQPLPKGAVLITMDDGYASVYQSALPILKRYAIPAVAFVTVSAIRDDAGGSGAAIAAADATGEGDEPEPHMTWQQLKALAAAGTTVASHGWTHRSLGKISLEEARDEAVRSRQVLQHHLEHPVSAFAYPFGTLADFNESTATVLKESGYTLAFTSQHGAIRPSPEPQQPLTPWLLPRIKVEGGEGLWMFRLLAHGGLDRWCWIDRTLWRLQQSPAG